MTLRINQFAGIAPVIAPHKLSNGLSQVAKNVRLDSGALEPMKGNAAEATLLKTNVKSIARYTPASTPYWFEFKEAVDMVPSQIYGTTTKEVFWTDGVKPKRTNASIATASTPYPSTSLSLGVPAPDGQITAGTPTGTPQESEFDSETRVYVVTFVTAEGYEGPPSLPVNIDLGVEQGCTLSALPTSAAGDYSITRKRIYRGSKLSGELHYLDEVLLNVASYVDVKTPDELGEALVTYDYDLPPNDLIGLTTLPNGVMAGFHGNELCFCEPYLPYAWPSGYRMSTEHDIVAIAAVGNGLFVATKGKPYFAHGTEPGSIILQQMESNQSCVSKGSMVDVGNACLYAGPDGLVIGDGSGARLIGDSLFSPEQWRELQPDSIQAHYHNEQYIFFYDNGLNQGGYIFDPSAKAKALTELDFYATAGYNDLETDTLYLLVGNDITAFQRGNPLNYTWRSGQYRLPNMMPYAAGRVMADAYPVTLSVINDDIPTVVTVEDDWPFRLPPLRRAQHVSVEVTGTATVKEILLGNDLEAVSG